MSETFSSRGSRRFWLNRLERAQAVRTGGSLYVPLEHGKIFAVLPGLTRASGRQVDLLPHGLAWLERETTFTVTRSTGAVTLVLNHAHGLIPEHVWTDTAGSLIAYDDLIRDGYEDFAPALADSVLAAESRDRTRFATALRAVPATPLVLRNGALFDPVRRRRIPQTTVIVRDSVIIAVGPDAQLSAPPGAQVIDLGGRTVMPGLWDMHSHAGGDFSWELFNLAAGVTGIRHMLRDTVTALRAKARPLAEKAFAPRTFWLGLLEGPGGRGATFATSDSTARLLVRRYAELGASGIKIYGQLPRGLVPAVTDEAHTLGLTAGGHIAAAMSLRQALASGYDHISHAPWLTANIDGDSVYLNRRGAFVLRGITNAAQSATHGNSFREVIDLLKSSGAAVDPTLALLEPSARASISQVRPYIGRVLGRLPPDFARPWMGWSISADSVADVWGRGHRALMALIAQLHRAGVRILPGTDDVPGFTLHRELELYVEAGIPPHDVLALATLGAAEALQVDSLFGSIAPGKRADLIVVDGDPVTRISDLRRVLLTMKNGAVYDPAALYGLYGIAPCCGDMLSPARHIK